MNINAGFWLMFGALFFLWLLFGSSRTSNKQQNGKTVTGGSLLESLKRERLPFLEVVNRERLAYALGLNAPMIAIAFVNDSFGNWKAFVVAFILPIVASTLIPNVTRLQTEGEEQAAWVLGLAWLGIFIYWCTTL